MTLALSIALGISLLGLAALAIALSEPRGRHRASDWPDVRARLAALIETSLTGWRALAQTYGGAL